MVINQNGVAYAQAGEGSGYRFTDIATASDAEKEIPGIIEGEDDFSGHEEDDESWPNDGFYDKATDSDAATASDSDAAMMTRLPAGTYRLRYEAVVDGKRQIIYEEEVSEGEDGSPPEVSERDGYTFAGWKRSTPYVNVNASCTVTATYVSGNVTMHVVNFVNSDGRPVVNPEYIQEGKGATRPATNLYKREGYTFLGWNKDFYNVRENMSIEPRYLEGDHTVYWKAYKAYYQGVERELRYELVPEGEDGTAPEVPEREGYTFAGWKRSWSYVNVQESGSVYGSYVSGDVEMYVVQFVDANGHLVVNPEYVEKGKWATRPGINLYQREGYTFLGWDVDYYNVEEDMVVEPRYLEGDHTVYWKSYKAYYQGAERELRFELVPLGEDGIPPEVPEREGYTFAGWKRSWPYVNVQESGGVYASYVLGDVEMHIVDFVNANGRSVVNPEYVEKGTWATRPGTNLYQLEDYTFLGWDTDYYNVENDMVVGPRYLEGQHTVYWKSYKAYYQGKERELRFELVPEGEDGTAPEIPEREGYTFAGWKRSWPYVNVQESGGVYASYVLGNVEMHIVNFVNANGRSVVNPEYVQAGKGATRPGTNLYKREGYTFLGWNQEFYNVTKDITVRPRYRIGEQQVYWKSYKAYYQGVERELKYELVPAGEDGTPPQVPGRDGYTFAGWKRSWPYVNVRESGNVYGSYVSGDAEMYIVDFVNVNGRPVVNPEYVQTGKGATRPGASLYNRTGYTFLGWDKEFYNVTEHTTVKPRYQIGKHQAYWLSYKAYHNNALTETKFEYVLAGQNGTPPSVPKRGGYTFSDWSPDNYYLNVTSSRNVTANYVLGDVKMHTVYFYGLKTGSDNYEVLKVESVPDGGSAQPPVLPRYAGHTLLKSQEVQYKRGATAPAEPIAPEGYYFSG